MFSMDRYASFLINRNRLVLILSLMLFLGAALGFLNTQLSTDFRGYFNEDNVDMLNLEALETSFGSADILYVAAIPKEGDIYNVTYLKMMRELSREADSAPHSARVESFTNHQKAVDTEEGLLVGPLLGENEIITPHIIDDIRRYAEQSEVLRNFWVSGAGDAAALKISFNFSMDEMERVKQMAEPVHYMRQLLADFELRYPGIDFHMIGSLVLNQSISEATYNDLFTCVPLCYVAIMVLLYLLLKQAQSIVVVITVITITNTVILGITEWAHVVLLPVVAFVPGAVMVIAVADCVHLLSTYYTRLHEGESKEEAIKASLKKNFRAVTITSVTTIIGFMCLSFSESPAYRQLGFLMSAGAFGAYFFSVTLLPSMLAYLDKPKVLSPPALQGVMVWFGGSMQRHYKLYFGATFSVVALLAIPFSNNQLNDNWHNFFDESVRLRKDTDRVNERIAGLHSIQYVIDAAEGASIMAPENLAFLEAFRNWFNSQPGVVYVASVDEVVRQLNQVFQEGDLAAYHLPNKESLAANYLMVYDMSVPNGMALSGIIDPDRTSTLFNVMLQKTYSQVVLDLVSKAEKWVAENRPDTIVVSDAVGGDVAFAKMSKSNTTSMLWGTLLAFVIISTIITALTRSFSYGAISLVANTVPALAAFGIWGLGVAEIGLATSTVVCMAIGIIVDDTVHFLEQYRYAKVQLKLSANRAMQHAYESAGLAIVTTTIILVAGFMILGMSTFNATADTGILLSITIVSALVIDLMMVPALLLMVDGWREKRALRQAQPEQAVQLALNN